jgi:hypothetical protein
MDDQPSKSKTRRSSVGTSAADDDEAEASQGASQKASQGARKAPKRKAGKMVIDEEIQIANKVYKNQLQDTSDITRDLEAEAIAAKKNSEAPPDLFSGPPGMSMLPPEALELDCFQPGNLNLAGRKQRSAKGAQASASADAMEEEELPEMERARSAAEPLDDAVQPDGEMEGAAGFGDEFGASTAFEEFGETQAFGDDPPDNGAPGMVPDTFEGGSQQLPNVDSNEMGKSKDTGGSQAGHTDPGQWSARTQKVRQPRLPALCVAPGVLPPTPSPAPCSGLTYGAWCRMADARHARRLVCRVGRAGALLRRYDRQDQEGSEAARRRRLLPGAALPLDARPHRAQAVCALRQHRHRQGRRLRRSRGRVVSAAATTRASLPVGQSRGFPPRRDERPNVA